MRRNPEGWKRASAIAIVMAAIVVAVYSAPSFQGCVNSSANSRVATTTAEVLAILSSYPRCLGVLLYTEYRAVLAIANLALAVSIFWLASSIRNLYQSRNLEGSLRESQTEVMRQIFAAAQRPWMSVVSVMAEQFVVTTERITLFAQFKARNSGKTPALAVNCFAEVFIPSEDEEDAAIALHRIMQRAISTNRSAGDTFFPNDERVGDQMILTLPITVLEKARAMDNEVAAELIGCLVYRFAFQEGQHQTCFRFVGLSVPQVEGRFPLHGARLKEVPAHVSPS
jgi:hypothetical protein